MSLEIYKTYVRFHELGDSQTVQQLFSAMSLVMCKPYSRSYKPGTLCFTMVFHTAHTLASLTAEALWQLEHGVLRWFYVPPALCLH